jgi:putative flippase GtrA
MKLFGKFALIGGLATLLQYLLLIVFVEWFSVSEVLSSALAYASSAVFNYLANYHLTFKSQAQHKQTFPKFVALAVSALMINTLLFFVVHRLGAHYLIAQLVATLITLIINFLAHKLWIYRK